MEGTIDGLLELEGGGGDGAEELVEEAAHEGALAQVPGGGGAEPGAVWTSLLVRAGDWKEDGRTLGGALELLVDESAGRGSAAVNEAGVDAVHGRVHGQLVPPLPCLKGTLSS